MKLPPLLLIIILALASMPLGAGKGQRGRRGGLSIREHERLKAIKAAHPDLYDRFEKEQRHEIEKLSNTWGLKFSQDVIIALCSNERLLKEFIELGDRMLPFLQEKCKKDIFKSFEDLIQFAFFLGNPEHPQKGDPKFAEKVPGVFEQRRNTLLSVIGIVDYIDKHQDSLISKELRGSARPILDKADHLVSVAKGTALHITATAAPFIRETPAPAAAASTEETPMVKSGRVPVSKLCEELELDTDDSDSDDAGEDDLLMKALGLGNDAAPSFRAFYTTPIKKA